jgi:hypothetical protein
MVIADDERRYVAANPAAGRAQPAHAIALGVRRGEILDLGDGAP